ncbi:putative short-chain type dehydrogenase [Xylaria nigripes]|nr:putative short-chain type dehydrogenase [Xylaria nigripes]
MPPPRGTTNVSEGLGDYDITSITNLAVRAVFISGATRGIGRSISVSFAKAGASMIAIGARSNLSETTRKIMDGAVNAGKPEPRVFVLKLDVTSQESVEAAVAEIKKTFGHPDAWWDTMTVNIKGPYLVMCSPLPFMLETEGLKTFVTVSSVATHLQFPTTSSYQISKLAVFRLTECLNVEYRNRGVITFSTHPGNVATELVTGPGGIVEDGLVHST